METTETEAPPLPISARHAQILRIMFEALAVRVARWVTLAMSFGLFLLAVLQPDWRRIVAASAFTILVNIPVWLRKADG